ncbi:long-chain-fatty-acid--CoA ligase [Roseomonas sp. CAU 1739]|uniref:long-chain-fatty-acid--CoA ligase n=1 Tax=Roseomonas sp. CAU 1739 TaxID=3140364 RepID=UPI00325B037D
MTSPWPAGVPRDVGPLPRSLGEALRRAALRRPGHVALAYYGTAITYGDLLGRVERLAGFLQHGAGVAKGDRVIVAMQNSPHFIIAFQAVVRAGAVVVPVNPMNTTAELDYLAADSGARVALVGAELLDRFLPLMPGAFGTVVAASYGDDIAADPHFRLPPVIADSILPAALPPGVVGWAEALAETRPPRPDDAAPDDLCVLPYTSGTTGKPKACMHTHAGTLFNVFAQQQWYGYGEDTVITAFMPMFHVAGMQVSMNGGLYAGATIVLMTRWDRDLVAPLFIRHGVTVWSAAPTMVVDVLASPQFDERAFARLRVLTGGGAPMPAAVAERLEARWGLRFIEGYGLSEAVCATHLNPMDRPKAQCLGIPIQQTVARVIDPDTLEDVATGEVGEIIIAGPQVMLGYWNRPEATAEAIIVRDGMRFLRTGDLGRVDAEGYFFLVDRLKRMINVNGFKVWPAECESTLYRHPAVQECCVVAYRDSQRGEAVRAFIVLRDGHAADAAAITAWARGEMAAYKVPRDVVFAASLPRSASNKVDWRRLRDAEGGTG